MAPPIKAPLFGLEILLERRDSGTCFLVDGGLDKPPSRFATPAWGSFILLYHIPGSIVLGTEISGDVNEAGPAPIYFHVGFACASNNLRVPLALAT